MATLLQRWLWYWAMGPLELYGRVTGVYRPPAPGPSWALQNFPAPRQGPIVAFGDSLTEGYGIASAGNYPSQLATLLRREVLNYGISGETTRDALLRLPDIQELNPAAVIVGFGGNDLMQRIDKAECFANLATIAQAFAERGTFVVLLGIRGSWLYKVDYDAEYRALARAQGHALVPLSMDDIWGVPWLMTDAAHPNARGYAIMARRVARVLAPALGVTLHIHARKT